MTSPALPFREYLLGHKYRVPHVRGTWLGRHGPRWWPVNGPMHDDAEGIKFPFQHWHIDARFVPETMWRTAAREHQIPERAFYAGVLHITDLDPLGHVRPRDHLRIEYGLKPWHQTRLQQTKAREYLKTLPRRSYLKPLLRPCLRPYRAERQLRHLATKLYKAGYQAARIDLDKRICPHKGADLSRIPERDGMIHCPLHGLRFCAETGESIWDRP